MVAVSPATHASLFMNQPTSIRRRPPQMSLGFMMLMMVVFSIMSAGLFYASQVPEVQTEVNVILGRESDNSDTGRLAHLVFILFTLTSPLLLAGTLSAVMAIRRWYVRQR